MADSTLAAVTDANFDELVLKADGPVLVDFWARAVSSLRSSRRSPPRRARSSRS
jgi:thioredoxin-like negative regulator of GroEL